VSKAFPTSEELALIAPLEKRCAELGAQNAALREALLLGLQLTDSGGHDGKSENCPTCHFANVARKALAEEPKP